MSISPVKRRRVKSEDLKYSSSQCSSKYFVRNELKAKVPVCVSAFTNILHISKFRLQRLAKQFHEDGYVCERRGGRRSSVKIKYDEQKNDIKEFISKLEFKEAHYCRGKSMRKYLRSDLSIDKLFKMYSDWTELVVKPKNSYFRFIFSTAFNIGFGSPASDVCSTCLSLAERIKAESGKKLNCLQLFSNSI